MAWIPPTTPRSPIDPLTAAEHDLILDRVKVKAHEDMIALNELRLHVSDPIGFIADRVGMRITAEVLAERLPPRTLTVRLTDPRWATWWDHLKATGKQKWWGWWWIGRLRPPRTVDTIVTGNIRIDTWWSYPAAHFRPGLGNPVLKTTADYTDGFPR